MLPMRSSRSLALASLPLNYLLALTFGYALQVGEWRIIQEEKITFKATPKRPLNTAF